MPHDKGMKKGGMSKDAYKRMTKKEMMGKPPKKGSGKKGGK